MRQSINQGASVVQFADSGLGLAHSGLRGGFGFATGNPSNAPRFSDGCPGNAATENTGHAPLRDSKLAGTTWTGSERRASPE